MPKTSSHGKWVTVGNNLRQPITLYGQNSVWFYEKITVSDYMMAKIFNTQ